MVRVGMGRGGRTCVCMCVCPVPLSVKPLKRFEEILLSVMSETFDCKVNMEPVISFYTGNF